MILEKILNKSQGQVPINSLTNNIELIKNNINNIIFTDNKNMEININGKEYQVIKALNGGKTNLVGLAKNKKGEKIVIKRVKDGKTSLQREIDFFGYISKHNIKGFPKLLDTDNGGKTIILEFQEGENGQDINFSNENWKNLGEDFGRKLKNLHENKIELSESEKQKSIDNMINYFDISYNDLKYFKKDFYKEKIKLKEILEEDNELFVMNHGDYSPHNCLFEKDKHGKYNISSILDPSGRAGYGSKYFDIVYLLNTRHTKNRENLEEGFFKEYEIDKKSKLFIQFNKIMQMYLIELYSLMNLEEDSLKIYNDYKKNN